MKNAILDATKMNVDGLHQRYVKTIAMALPAVAEVLLAYYDALGHGSHRLVKEFIGSCEVAFCANFATSIEEFGAIYKKCHDFNMTPSQQPIQNPAANEGAAATAPINANQATTTPGATVTPPVVNPYDTPRNAHTTAPIINGRNDMYAALQSLIDGIIRALEAYRNQVDENNRARRIKEVFSR